jgi:FlaG/FlaF family flagellin (archaellin)
MARESDGGMIGDRLGAVDRGISKEGMAAVAFGLTVLMMAVTGGLLMQTSDSLTDGGPTLATSADPVTASGENSQWVRIAHESGDTVAVADIEVVVTLPDHDKRARLHGLPTERLTQDDYAGNHVFTRGTDGVDGVVAAPDGSDARFEAGDEIALRIEQRRVDLVAGQTVEVELRHTESDTRLSRERISVVG